MSEINNIVEEIQSSCLTATIMFVNETNLIKFNIFLRSEVRSKMISFS